MRTFIIGLGNPILGDDGAGWHVAREVGRKLSIELDDSRLPSDQPGTPDSISIACFALSGIALMERMVGYDRVILIDSLNTGYHLQGDVVVMRLAELADLTCGHTASPHDASLKTALALGRQLGALLPPDEDVTVIAIESLNVHDFKEELSTAVAAAVPLAVHHVLALLEN